MQKWTILLLLTLATVTFADYTISGKISGLANKDIKLQGINIEPFLLDSTTGDAQGNFSLHYPDDYSGMAKLQADGRELNLLLHKENFTISATSAGVQFNESPENQIQLDYVKLSKAVANMLSAWKNVAKFYTKTSAEAQYIMSQISKLKQQLLDFKQKIDPDLYVSYYIKISDMIEQMAQSVRSENYLALMQQHQADFNQLDFTDRKLNRSGLLPKLLGAYFLMLESHGVAKQYPHMNHSIDKILASVQANPELLQNVSVFLWDYLEGRSSFKAAEHLSKVMLDKYQATNWPVKLYGRFEKYRKMAKGQRAADIVFKTESGEKHLSDIKTEYKVIVFWESECDKCIEELDALNKLYPWLKQNKVELIAISLDEDKKRYQQVIKTHNWQFELYNDFNGWQSQVALDYFIYKTPAMFLLDDKHTMQTEYLITNALQVEGLIKQFKQKK